MVNKVLKYLNNTINQEKLFNSIDHDIREIIKPYDFQKVIFIKSEDTGELQIQLQDPIPTKLINELDEYTGLNGVLEKSQYSIELTYKIDK